MFSLPPFVFSFYVHAFAGAIILLRRKGTWNKSARKRLLLLVLHAAWQVLGFVLWATALIMLHPMQAIIAEYCEYLFVALLTEHKNRNSGGVATRRRGMVLRFILSMCILTVAHIWYETPTWQPTQQSEFPQPDTTSGIILMIIYAISEVLRKSLKTWLSKAVGSHEVVTSISTLIAAPMLFPFVLLYGGLSKHQYQVLQSPSRLVCLFICSVLLITIPTVLFNSSSTLSSATRSTTPRRQLAIAAGTAYVLHLFCVYNPGNTPLSWTYNALLCLSCILMMSALTSAHKIIIKNNAPLVVDPFADYELPENEFENNDFLSATLRNPNSRKLFIFLCITTFYMVIEFLYGIYAGSLGLVSDSFHMLLDSASVAIALYASRISTYPATEEFNYGLGRYEVLSGFTNGVLLVCIAVYIVIESVERIMDPPDIDASWLLSVSVGGLAINVIGVVFFHEAHHVGGSGGCCHGHGDASSNSPASPTQETHGHGLEISPKHGHAHSHSHSHSHGSSSPPQSPKKEKTQSMNMRGVYLHILADLFGSIGVIISSSIVSWTGWTVADPICSCCIAVLIFISSIPLISDTGRVLLQCLTEDQAELLDSCLREVSATDGVEKIKSHGIWQYTPGVPVGSISVSTSSEVDEAHVRSAIQRAFQPLLQPSSLTVEISRANHYYAF